MCRNVVKICGQVQRNIQVMQRTPLTEDNPVFSFIALIIPFYHTQIKGEMQACHKNTAGFFPEHHDKANNTELR
jgi:hypothetical protein